MTSDKLGPMFQAIGGTGIAILLSFIFSWQLCLIMLIFVPIIFGSGVFVGKATTNTLVKGKTSNEEAGRLAIETVENIRTVVSLGRERFFIDEFETIYSTGFSRTVKMLHVQAILSSISNSLLFFIQTAAFSMG